MPQEIQLQKHAFNGGAVSSRALASTPSNIDRMYIEVVYIRSEHNIPTCACPPLCPYLGLQGGGHQPVQCNLSIRFVVYLNPPWSSRLKRLTR